MIDQPYRGLDSYEEEDTIFFFGREPKRQEVIRYLKKYKLTIMYGASGIGKSSLLQAGVASHLRLSAKENRKDPKIGVPKFAIVVFKNWYQQALSSKLLEEVHKAVIEVMKDDGESFQQKAKDLQEKIEEIKAKKQIEAQEKELPLPSDFILDLQAWAELVRGECREGKLIIVLDQFEEYFQHYPQAKDQFAKEFTNAVNWNELPVNFLISIQEAWLGRLKYFKGKIPTILSNLIHIEHLKKTEAEEAIKKPIQAYNLQQTIISNLMNGQVTELHGEENIGKSFILNAGICYRLSKIAKENLKKNLPPEFVVIKFDSWGGNPVSNLKQQIEIEIKSLFEDREVQSVSPSLSLEEILRNWTKVIEKNCKLLIILDQFEQYFHYPSQENGKKTFITELENAFKTIKENKLPVKFLISIRTDRKSKLDRFKGYIDSSLQLLQSKDNFLVIDPPDDEVYKIDGNLVKGVFNQSDKVFPDDLAEGQIEPLYLQLVMTRLWEKTKQDGKYCLSLDVLKELGGVQKIINNYVKDKIESLSLDVQEDVANIFYNLVPPSGQRIAYAVSDLAYYLRDSDYKRFDKEHLSPLLNKLASPEIRLLRYVKPSVNYSNEECYEIFHDLFVHPILEWLKENREKNIILLARLCSSYWDWYDKAKSLEKQGHYEEAINCYNQALKFRPQDYWSRFGQGMCWKELGHSLMKQGNHSKARDLHQKAIESFKKAPLQYSDWYHEARTLEKQGYHEEAIYYYNQALKIYPQDYWTLYGLGMCMYELGQYDEASNSFERALKEKPNDYSARRHWDDARSMKLLREKTSRV